MVFSKKNTFLVIFGIFLSAFFIFTNEARAATYETVFTSQVIDVHHTSVDYGTISWDATLETSTSLVMQVRAGNVFDTGDASWTGWATVSSGASLDAYDGYKYIQYKATLGTDNLSYAPSLNSVTITTNVSTLISSKFNSYDSQNIVNNISWTETLDGSSDVALQIRTSADGSTWSNWCGPDNAGSGCDRESFFTDPSGSENSDAMFKDQSSDQYFQYKAILISDSVGGSDLPEISVINTDY